MVDVKKINKERLEGWEKKCNDQHATPVLMICVGHDHVVGNLSLVISEEMPIESAIIIMQSVLRRLANGATPG